MREPQRQVGPQGLVDRVHPEPDVGGDEAAARDEREQEAGHDHPLGPRPCTTTLGSSGGRPSMCSANSFSSETRATAPGSWATAADPSRRGEGGGVPITRCGAPGPSVPSVSSMSLMTTSAPSPSARRSWVTPLRGNPHRDEHQEAHPAEEDHQALGDRPGPAEGEAARVGLDPGLRDVGDDVALGLRGQRAVGEHRHGLGPGQHRRVDLGRGGRGQRRRVLAVGQRAARPGEAVALRAVGAEQLRADARCPPSGVHLLGGRNRGAAAQRGDVTGDVVDLPRGERHRLALVLRADFLGRHAAGGHLEVDRGRARADQAGSPARCPGPRGRGSSSSSPGTGPCRP